METTEKQTKACPQCKTEIPLAAKKCPNCQSDIRNWWLRHPVMILIIATPFLIGIITSLAGDSSPTPPAAPTEYEVKLNAGGWAQGYVEQILKSPSTAKFGNDSVEDLGEGRYRVSNYVDSQNSFGATMRSDWTAIMKYSGSSPDNGASWTLERLVFDGEVVFGE